MEGPVLFQCIHCRNIVGDSLSLISTSETLKVVVVSSCTSVTKSPRSTTVESSTFCDVNCSRCRNPLGKLYSSSPDESLTQGVAFDVDSLQSYVLGSAVMTGSAIPETSREIARAESTLPPTAEDKLRSELLKVQTIILLMNERLQSLETEVALGRIGPQQSPKRRRGDTD